MNAEDILSEWESSAGKLSRKEFAKMIGISKSRLNNLLYQQRKKQRKQGEKKQGDEGDTKESVNITSNGVYTEIESKSRRIKTLEDLVEVCNIDLEKYKIERWVANKWEVGISDKGGGIIVEPLFQVKATLLPKQPESVHLTIQSVNVPVNQIVRDYQHNTTSGKGLVIPDTQIGFRKDQLSGRLTPFHDREAMDIILQIARDGDYTHVNFLGDVLDLNDWSDKFLKEPEFYFTTQPAIHEAHWWMSQFRQACPNARITKLEGNHEYRMPKMLILHLIAAHGLTSATDVKTSALSLDFLLGLSGLQIEYIGGYPHNEDWMGPVRLIHGDVAKSGTTETVKAVAGNSEETVIQGHIHKIEWASRTIKSRSGIRTISAFSPGCLCRVDYTVPGHKHPQQWQQGACEVEWHGDDYQITPIVIQNGNAIHRGKVYRGGDVLSYLNKDTEEIRNGWSF